MRIIKGHSIAPQRRVIYGPPGVGKTKFASSEPGAVVLDYEFGAGYLGVDRVVGPRTWAESLALVREACGGPGDHKAIVIDTIDRLEAQLSEEICRAGIEGKVKKSLGEYGFNAGYRTLGGRWREFLYELDGARAKGRSVTLIAHAQRAKVTDPTLGDYSKFIGTLHVDCWNATAQWADAVLFANYEAGLLEHRALMTGARVLHTVAGTGFDAKHRPNIEAALPLEWGAYAQAVAGVHRGQDEIVASIRALAASTPELLAKAEEFILNANGDPLRLATIETKLKEKVHS
jgi:hypothetical protein